MASTTAGNGNAPTEQLNRDSRLKGLLEKLDQLEKVTKETPASLPPSLSNNSQQ